MNCCNSHRGGGAPCAHPHLLCMRAVCPFMIYGELVQRWRLAQGAVLRKWPQKQGVWRLCAHSITFCPYTACLLLATGKSCNSRGG